jgi:hypothetical protein
MSAQHPLCLTISSSLFFSASVTGVTSVSGVLTRWKVGTSSSSAAAGCERRDGHTAVISFRRIRGER